MMSYSGGAARPLGARYRAPLLSRRRAPRKAPALSQFDADRGLAILVDEGGQPGTPVEQRLAHCIRGPAMVEVVDHQRAAPPQQAMQLRMQLRHRSVAVKKGQVVTGLERRQDVAEIALVHDDPIVHAGCCDIFACEPYVLAVAFDRIDDRLRRATGEAQSGVAERGAELEDALGVNRGSKRTEQGAVAVGPGAATMLRTMRQRRRAHLRQWIDRLL